MSQDVARAARLAKSLQGLLSGQTPLSKRNYLQFLEAICAQPDPATCLGKIMASSHGVACVQEAMRVDLTPTFLNGPGSQLLRYLSASNLSTLGGGEFLSRIVIAIVDPPFFLNAFVDAFKTYKLDDEAQIAFSWLLLQLLRCTDDDEIYFDLAKDPSIIDRLLASAIADVRSAGELIKHITQTRMIGDFEAAEYGPGGRHDNDKIDFREIAIMPTADEIMSKQAPFLRKSVEIEDAAVETRVADYLDNLFRLLREDMIYETREELQKILDNKLKTQRVFPVDHLRLSRVHHIIDQPAQQKWKRGRWSVLLERTVPFPQLAKMSEAKRRDWLRDNRRFLKHRSLACVLLDKDIIAFATIDRDEDLLSKTPPVIVLQFEGEVNAVKALLKMKNASNLTIVPVDTAVFAYEPILKTLQESRTLPLSQELLFWTTGKLPGRVQRAPLSIEATVRSTPNVELQNLLQMPKSVKLDPSQSDSFLAGLTQTVAIIQGPPGTGKSFIGALLAKALYEDTNETILLVCFKNHALDQFLEDLLDIGVPESAMLRLGGKSTLRTEPMSLFQISRSGASNYKFTRNDWTEIGGYRQAITSADDALKTSANRFMNTTTEYRDIMELVEFEDEDFYYALKVHPAADGMQQVTKKGKPIGPYYLLHQWINGWDAGALRDAENVQETQDVWGLPLVTRKRKYDEWRDSLLKEQAERIAAEAVNYNDAHARLARKYAAQNLGIVKTRRIIACTTTAAAMYRDEINAASPDVVIVEEACEILESHVITALAEDTKQIIMIGDHKQLRPKINSYTLNVDSHEGFDLNRSLFERLVRRGFPHQTLGTQHRMRPEISRLVRALTYPSLVDAPSTQGRPDVRGIRNNVVFIHHEHPEDDLVELGGFFASNEASPKSSKQNSFEVEMVLKIVRYLGQNGYSTNSIVLLTPYLGQLRALQQALRDTNDPILGDLDSADLVRAGLVSQAAATVSKQPIRLATIDNYQGEESDIVIASLTRSNAQNTIGFMASPERVNVLLSRARDGMIMIGNAHTFQNSRSGKDTWSQLFGLLKQHGHIYDGLPIRCERHPTREALLSNPDDFDRYSPDGGCSQPCGARLNCGHLCPSKCHQISDHSKMQCEEILYTQCPKSHRQQYRCQQGPPDSCFKCDREAKMAAKRQQQEFERQERQDREQRRHAEQLAEIEAEITRQRETTRALQVERERANALEQKKQDAREAADFARRAATATSSAPLSGATQASKTSFTSTPSHPISSEGSSASSADSTPARTAPVSEPVQVQATTAAKPKPTQPAPELRSLAREEWERQKTLNGETNEAIDKIMDMTGLEKVKQTVLDIKTTVETSQRQGTSLKDRRFNVSMLGNPGTGKTTVARTYAKFLASVQVVSGTTFVETTGSRLANEGVAGVKKTIEKVVEDGGGTIFVDEAYQLATQHNFQGGQVLDFLLAEMENNVGSLVFIFAGYTREMEKFFEHNVGLGSRVPYSLLFEDYSDAELLDMLEGLITKKFSGRMKVVDADGVRGLYGRIAVRRLGRGRGRPGFGNARALQNMFTNIHERQARRLRHERSQGGRPDDMLLTQEDLIGPNPADVMQNSEAYQKLQKMIGLKPVKHAVTSMLEMMKSNYLRELRELQPHQVSLNRVFLGPPGTGKTTVASIWGTILSEMGLLSKGEVVVKNPADFIGSALGQSESQTKAILANTVGKVLVIDEAYMLYGRSGSAGNADPYKTAVIDTLVAEVQSTPGEDRCILLLGYKEQMEDMFRNVNEGLSRRFAIQDAFHFENYSDEELLQALNMKLYDQDLTATSKAKEVAIGLLARARMQSNFGNIGEVVNLLSKAKVNYQARQGLLPEHERSPDAPFEPEDFDPDCGRSERASGNLAQLFADVVGCEDVVSTLGDYQRMAQTARTRGKDPRDLIPTNFIFKGPPGCGKTTTARKLGSVFYDMGLLSSTEVVECSATDLVGEYVGQTGPKTRSVFERALGRVLFVDEAYRFAEGHFAKEAMDEIVGILTDERFRAKLIVVFAGYDHEMDELLSVNTGLTSRFQKHITFRNLEPSQALEILRKALAKHDVKVLALDNPSSSAYVEMYKLVESLAETRGWGNARDMNSLAREMTSLAFKIEAATSSPEESLTLPDKDVISCMKATLSERMRSELRASVPQVVNANANALPTRVQDPHAAPPPLATTIMETAEEQQPIVPVKLSNLPEDVHADGRDAQVSDAVWAQLTADKLAEERAEAELSNALRQAEEEAQSAAAREEESSLVLNSLLEQQANERSERDELMRLREQARLKAIAEREASARAAAELENRRRVEAARRKEEAQVQAKLQAIGVCVAGYRWIKQASGYRCAGGSHFVDNAALGLK